MSSTPPPPASHSLPRLSEEDLAALPPPPSSSASEHASSSPVPSVANDEYPHEEEEEEEGDEEFDEEEEDEDDEEEGEYGGGDDADADDATPQSDDSNYADEADEEGGEAADPAAESTNSKRSSSSSSNNNGDTLSVENLRNLGDAQAAMDAPLTMPESLPAPPSDSTATPPSLTSASTPCSVPDTSPLVMPQAALEAANSFREEDEGEEQQLDTPTVVDSASAPTPVNEEEGEGDDFASAAAAVGSGAGTPLPVQQHQQQQEEEEGAASCATTQHPRTPQPSIDGGEEEEERAAESLRVAEDNAASALDRFRTCLHAKLVEHHIDSATATFQQTLQDAFLKHDRQVRALIAHNSALETKLQQQEARMHEVQVELKESILRDFQRVVHMDLRSALRETDEFASLDESPTSPLAEGSPTLKESMDTSYQTEEEGDEKNEEDRDAQSWHDAAASAAASGAPLSMDELVAAYLATRNTIALLRREQTAWRANVHALRQGLLAATQENAALRQQVELLRTTTVDLAEHRSAVEAREEAEHQCELLRLQLVKQAEEAESLMALWERQEVAQEQQKSSGSSTDADKTRVPAADPSSSSSPATATTAAAVGAEGSHNEEDDAATAAAAMRRGPVWDMAIRELEEQVTVAANSRHLRERIAELEAQLQQLQAERDASVHYATELRQEGDVLRADAQSLVYRNGVLSQQVASLLVQAETATRTSRVLREENAALQKQVQSLSDAAATAAAAAAPSASASSLLRSGAFASQRPSPQPSSLLAALSELPSRRSRWLAATSPPPTPVSLNTAVIYEEEKEKEMSSSPTSRRPLSDVRQLLYMPGAGAAADVRLQHSPTEVEEGLQRRLSTYAASHVPVPPALQAQPMDEEGQPRSSAHSRLLSRSRQASLRQLGSGPLEVGVTSTTSFSSYSAPRLPASDQLSGSARGRPSAYTTIDPAKGTVTRHVGSAEVTVVLRGSGGGDGGSHVRADAAAAAASSGMTTVLASEDDVNSDPQLLCLLDTLDKDETLDRFSVNSVSELVVRNQELVKQLYDAEQRAAAAEEGLQQQRQQQKEAAEKEEEDRVHRRESIRSVAAQLPASLTAPTAALLQHAKTAAEMRRHASPRLPHKRDREADEEDKTGGDGDGSSASGARWSNQQAAPPSEQQQQQQRPRGSFGLVESDHGEGRSTVHQQDPSATASSPAAATRNSENATAAEAQPWFLESASEAVASMVDALVRRHEISLTSVDTDVSNALLRALAAQREAERASAHAAAAHDPHSGWDSAAAASNGDTSTAAADTVSATPPSRAMAVCLRSLLQLCVRQSATLAEVALNAADQQRDMQQAVKETWTDVQSTLLKALQATQGVALPAPGNTTTAAIASPSLLSASSLRTSAAQTLVASSPSSSPPHKQPRHDGDASADTLVAEDRAADALTVPRHDDFRVEEQVALLQELTTLLQTAARKDGTLLHVYQAAQARQEARQHEQQERMTRLVLKLERKRRLIKALRTQQQQAHAGAAQTLDPNRAVSHAAQEAESTQSTITTTTAAAGAAAGAFRLSPQPGSPGYRTPPLPPMSLPSATLPGSPQPLLLRHTQSSRAEGDSERHTSSSSSEATAAPSSASDGHVEEEDDDESEMDDEALTLDIFRELQQQLALSQASHRAAQEELDAEKLHHTTLLERMWALEIARDDAVAAKDAMAAQLAETVPRATYSTTAAELEATAQRLAARDAELSTAVAEGRTLEARVVALTAQLEAQETRSTKQYEQLEEVAQRRALRLETEEARYRELQARLADAVQHAASLENTLALLRRAMQDKEDLLRQRESYIDELKLETLMRTDVQALLCQLYPDHTALQANAVLVQRLSQSTARLQVELAEARQDLAHTREELRLRDLRVREAVQDRQAAEAGLQDALARLAHVEDEEEGGRYNGGGDGDGDDDRRPASASAAAGDSLNPLSSPSMAEMDALFNVAEAPAAALRHRVRYLTTRLEALSNDLTLKCAAEAAWKAREAELRQQLELMSTDPISLTARKYGLKACATFMEQMAEMQQRHDGVQESLAAAEAERARLTAQLKTALAGEAEAERQRAEATAQLRRLEEQLAAARAQCSEQAATLALRAAEGKAMEERLADLQQQHQRVLADLHDKERALRAAQATLDECRAQRDRFLSDNNSLVSAVKSLEANLIQSEAEKVRAQETLAQGLSSSAASTRRRRDGGRLNRSAAMERYSGHSSLTQDLSLSSLAPPS